MLTDQILNYALLGAIAAEEYETVINLIDAGASLAGADSKGRTALHHAAQQQCPEIVHALIEHGADLAARDLDGQTPLHLAISRGNSGMLRTLIDAGADVHAKDNSGITPQGIAQSSAMPVGIDEVLERAITDSKRNHCSRLGTLNTNGSRSR